MKKSKFNSSTQTELKHGVRLVPQQLIASAMLQASNEELQRIIDAELQKNFVLESDDSHSVDEMVNAEESKAERTDDREDADVSLDEAGYEDMGYGETNYDDSDSAPLLDLPQDPNKKDFSPLTNYSSDTSFRESLKEQLSVLDIGKRERFLANYLVDSLEDDGYLRRPLLELVDSLAWNQNVETTEEELQTVLIDVVQANLEPAGIGARDLRECLLLQLDEQQSSEAAMLAYQVIDEDFEDYKKQRFDRIKDHFDLSDKEIEEIQKIVRHLNPRPGGMSASTDMISSRAAQVRPDFFVTNEEGTLVVSLNNCRIPAVRISPDYNEMLQNLDNESSNKAEVQSGKDFLEKGIRSANIFINALIQRRNTLITVMRTIVELQYEFFLTGNIEDLTPMNLKAVATRTKLDISTVSRVTSTRYVQTEFGIFSLKSIFTPGVAMKGRESAISNKVIKNALKEIVDGENKQMPYNDDELKKRLAEMGYTIARRTVVKYRTALGIPKYELRKR